jgi:hypothetical protein
MHVVSYRTQAKSIPQSHATATNARMLAGNSVRRYAELDTLVAAVAARPRGDRSPTSSSANCMLLRAP